MTRLPPALIRRAAHENPFLPLLLRVCRDLPSARNELRWLEEYVQETVASRRRRLYDMRERSGDLGEQVPIGHHGARIARISRNTFTGHNRCRVLANRGSVAERNFCTIHGPLAAQPTGSSRNSEGKTVRRHIYSSKGNKKDQASPGRKISKGVQRRAARRNLSNTRDNATAEDGSSARKAVSDGMRNGSDQLIRKFLTKAVHDRSRGKPLQHILGNQPFGNLKILTPNTVLIPRPETEAYTENVANMLASAVQETDQRAGDHEPRNRRKLRILDLCTGSGCIALLLHSILKPPPNSLSSTSSDHHWPSTIDLEILGVDYHPTALEVANRNLHHNIYKGLLHPEAATDISFMRQDLLRLTLDTKTRRDPHIRRTFNLKTEDGSAKAAPAPTADHEHGGVEGDVDPDSPWDVVISNPPYISEKDYAPGGTTERSVRKFEPKTALVPENGPSVHSGDLFYWPLAQIFDAVGARLLVMELGGAEQAARVHKVLTKGFRFQARRDPHALFLECWKDDGTVIPLPILDSGNRMATHDRPTTAATTASAESESDDAPDRALFLWSGPLAVWRREQVGETDVPLRFEFGRLYMPKPAKDHQRQEPPLDLIK
ncbi:hypothetical protein H2204_013231 [Knufia peltigerae]|uniref:Uncharacterized protein n=1 Tax=Knufia peltigerae TaxID=1002370 RepID=A0AA38XR72_9EURO|nr:hypothetical protein H2204_013231 [Knufia peltigerae]